ncbi:MAG: hypothetical protein ACK5L3_14095, partial [Oscillospiraceae bacterium]
LLLPYLLRKLNQWFFHSKSALYFRSIKFLRTLHKPVGAILLVVIAVHGWLALGSFTFHTGTFAAIAFLLTGLLGLLFFLRKKPGLVKAHRIFALCSVLLVAFHLAAPWALS